MIHLYVLRDPATREIRYIGLTLRDPKIRLSEHYTVAKNDRYCRSKRDKWIRRVLDSGRKPEMEIVGMFKDSEEKQAVAFESKMIAALNAQGIRLTNGKSRSPMLTKPHHVKHRLGRFSE